MDNSQRSTEDDITQNPYEYFNYLKSRLRKAPDWRKYEAFFIRMLNHVPVEELVRIMPKTFLGKGEPSDFTEIKEIYRYLMLKQME